MNINISDQRFIICGATSGFGHAIAKQIISEGGHILAVARGEEKLKEIENELKATRK